MNPVERTARKQHRCNFCELPIEPGARYIYERITPWDHPDNEGYETWRGHVECRNEREMVIWHMDTKNGVCSECRDARWGYDEARARITELEQALQAERVARLQAEADAVAVRKVVDEIENLILASESDEGVGASATCVLIADVIDDYKVNPTPGAALLAVVEQLHCALNDLLAPDKVRALAALPGGEGEKGENAK